MQYLLKIFRYDADVAEDISQGIIEIVSGSRETVFLVRFSIDYSISFRCTIQIIVDPFENLKTKIDKKLYAIF